MFYVNGGYAMAEIVIVIWRVGVGGD